MIKPNTYEEISTNFSKYSFNKNSQLETLLRSLAIMNMCVYV